MKDALITTVSKTVAIETVTMTLEDSIPRFSFWAFGESLMVAEENCISIVHGEEYGDVAISKPCRSISEEY